MAESLELSHTMYQNTHSSGSIIEQMYVINPSLPKIQLIPSSTHYGDEVPVSIQPTQFYLEIIV